MADMLTDNTSYYLVLAKHCSYLSKCSYLFIYSMLEENFGSHVLLQ